MPSLVMLAGDPEWSPDDPAALLLHLARLGLIGPLQTPFSTQTRYPAGPRFLSLVTFLGCSPHVVLDDTDAGAGQACSVRLHLYDRVRFLSAAHGVRARCPHCRHAVDLPVDGVYSDPFLCDQCQAESTLGTLDWRQSAGFGRCFVELLGIHAHEAVPSDSLIAGLGDWSGTDWRYFYSS